MHFFCHFLPVKFRLGVDTAKKRPEMDVSGPQDWPRSLFSSKIESVEWRTRLVLESKQTEEISTYFAFPKLINCWKIEKQLRLLKKWLILLVSKVWVVSDGSFLDHPRPEQESVSRRNVSPKAFGRLLSLALRDIQWKKRKVFCWAVFFPWCVWKFWNVSCFPYLCDHFFSFLLCLVNINRIWWWEACRILHFSSLASHQDGISILITAKLCMNTQMFFFQLHMSTGFLGPYPFVMGNCWVSPVFKPWKTGWARPVGGLRWFLSGVIELENAQLAIWMKGCS